MTNNPIAPWTVDLLTPQSTPAKKLLDWRVDNLFLVVVARAVLHEIGHVLLGHEYSLFPDKLKAR
jgi:hypothetical protein